MKGEVVDGLLSDDIICFYIGRTNAFAVSNKDLPCDPEFGFQTKVYGVNGKEEEKN